jgi:hypothetical protein
MNIFRGLFIASASFLIGCCAVAARGQTLPITIDHAPPVSFTSLYDPRLPSTHMPAPEANELGVTIANFSCHASVTGHVFLQFPSGEDVVAAVRVDTVHVTLHLRVDEWLDRRAGAKILAHEDGHAMIARHFYDRSDVIAAIIAKNMIGTDFYGSGPDAETAATDALNVAARQIDKEYMQQVRDPSEIVQDAYDQITEHGTNQIDEIDAIEQALRMVINTQIAKID